MFAEAAKSNWEKLISGDPACIDVPEWKTESFDGKIYVEPEPSKDRAKHLALLGDVGKRAEAFARVIVSRARRYDSDGDLVPFYRTPESREEAVKTLMSNTKFEVLSRVGNDILWAFTGSDKELGNS